MAITITCPGCTKVLKLARTPPEGKRVICPKCSHRFMPTAAPEPVPELVEPLPESAAAAAAPAEEPSVPATASTPAPAVFGKPLALAIIATVVLVGAAIVTAIFLTRPDATPPVVQVDPPAPTAPDTRDEAKDKERQAQEKRRASFQRCMIDGNAALAEQRYEDAVAAYTEAMRLAPEDVDAAKGLNTAKTGLAALTKEKTDADKLKSDLARLLEEGKQALTEKKYAQAVRVYEAVLVLAPGDLVAAKALDEARAALAVDAEEKKKLADYQKYMDAGRAAVVAQRYTDAIREYTAALAVLPGDMAALDARRQVEKRLGDEQNDGKRRDAFTQAMAQGAAAVKARRYEDAVQAFELAVKMMPSDKDAQAALALAKKTLAEGQATLTALMNQAETAARLGRLEEASRLYSEANRLFPGNANVQAALQNLQRMMGDVQTAQQAYLRYMNQAALAMQAKRFEDAARNYAEALRLVPNDRDAAIGLRESQQNFEREARNRPQYNQAMQRTVNAYKQGKYLDAVKHYQDALVLMPDDTAAMNGVRLSRYAQYMSDGDNDIKAKRYVEAVRDYENALRELPGDQAAARGMQQARQLAQKK